MQERFGVFNSFLNVEIKARINNPARVRKYLVTNNAAFIGTDHQTDTYFNVRKGRLKIREGNIENNLIFYERDEIEGPKNSNFYLIEVNDPITLKEVLSKSIGIKVIVKKKREIYFIDNIKFHIDEVPGAGNFVEIEASNKYADLPQEKLKEQCEFYKKELGIMEEDLIARSYSDIV